MGHIQIRKYFMALEAFTKVKRMMKGNLKTTKSVTQEQQHGFRGRRRTQLHAHDFRSSYKVFAA